MRLAYSAVLAAVLPVAAVAQLRAPVYQVEPCCDLCKRAHYPASYQATSFLQRFETLIQGADDWLFRAEDLRTLFGADEEAYGEMRRLRTALKNRGTDLVLLYPPTRGLVHADKLPAQARQRFDPEAARRNYLAALERFRQTGLVVPDMTPLLNDNPDAPFYFRGDHHWTPEGARRTARLMAEAIRALPSYAEIPRRRFQTERTGVLWKKEGGTLKQAAAQICGFSYPDHYVSRYATFPVDHADLFSEEAPAKVVLAGTSSSEGDYNFAGFLAEYLNADVLNMSVSGGKHDGAMLRVLSSEDFRRSPPKVIVWEVEPIHNLSSRSFYRQAVPLIYNGCEGRPAILKNRVRLTRESTEVLFNGGGEVLPLAGKDHLVDLKLSGATPSVMRGTVWYTNGAKELVKFRYSGAAEPADRYVLELRHDHDWGEKTFMSLDLRLPEEIAEPVWVDARLCRRKNPADIQARVTGVAR